MNDTQDELRRAVDFTFRALHDAATMSDRLEHYARADGDRAAELAKQIKYLNQRIDKVAEIIGERVSGLVDEINEMKAVDLKGGWNSLGQATRDTSAPAFPTGGASTAEAAAEAVLPVPQRGDRVRLEGATSTGGHRVPPGWYDVIGADPALDAFQIKGQNAADEHATFTCWVYVNDRGFKEVRHGDQH